MIRNEWKNRGLCCGIVMGSVMLMVHPLVGILMEIKYTHLHDCEYDFTVFIIIYVLCCDRYLLDTIYHIIDHDFANGHLCGT